MHTILSWGMGVESTAILVRWLLEPETRPCALDELLVLTAQTGDEYEDTGVLCERYILPLLRAERIRFVEVARRGHLEKEGIVVLANRRSPGRMHMDGAYKLSDELRSAGTSTSGGQVSFTRPGRSTSLPVLLLWTRRFATVWNGLKNSGKPDKVSLSVDEVCLSSRRFGTDAVDELVRLGLLQRGGMPCPVPEDVAMHYPENMKEHAREAQRRRSRGESDLGYSSSIISLTKKGWDYPVPDPGPSQDNNTEGEQLKAQGSPYVTKLPERRQLALAPLTHTPATQAGQASLMQVLREEMFALDEERIQCRSANRVTSEFEPPLN